jgi:hypothetical protein
MKLIDIDRLEISKSHIHYIKSYKGRVILMNKQAEILSYYIQFSLEHKPVGLPEIKINFIENPHLPMDEVMPKIISKIYELNDKGALAERGHTESIS